MVSSKAIKEKLLDAINPVLLKLKDVKNEEKEEIDDTPNKTVAQLKDELRKSNIKFHSKWNKTKLLSVLAQSFI
jgi:hypothetical protein